MDPISIGNPSAKELLNAQAHLWNHIFSYLNSMALKCAIQLGIPDAIQKHGKPMAVNELAISLSLHPNKTPFFSRMMRLLSHSDFFSKQILSTGEEAFDLTTNSQLLLKGHPLTLAPLALLVLDPVVVEPSYKFGSWFQNEKESPFHMTHGRSFWEYGEFEPKFNKLFNEAMTSDAQFVAKFLVSHDEFKGLVEGVESLVDVGGGNGTMAMAIAKLFPKLMCIIFDQPHVVNEMDGYVESNLKYVGGDMLRLFLLLRLSYSSLYCMIGMMIIA